MASREYVVLVASTVSTVTLDGARTRRVMITSVDGSEAIYATAGVSPVDPTVRGDDTFMVPKAAGAFRVVELPSVTTDAVVKLISAGTPTVGVENIDDEWR